MSWSTEKGFNFRQTSGYDTDGANETYVLVATSYPTTRTVGGESVTFGWESAPDDSRDRTTAYSPKIAGFNFKNAGGSEDVFRVDLPSAGSYRIRAAFGDPSNNQGHYIEVRDTSSVLFTVGSATSANSKALVDPNGTAHYAVDWDANNTTLDDAFSTTIFRVALLPMTSLLNSIAHVGIEQLSSGPSLLVLQAGYRQQ